MKAQIPEKVLRRVAATVERYDLAPGSERIALAFSGGKDSLVLALSLRELGFSVVPLVVDMGYEDNWNSRLAARCRDFGFTAEIVDARTPSASTIQQLTISRKAALAANIDAVLEQPSSLDQRFTPCTSCYNTKVIAMDDALEALQLDRIAFGHHATDAAASALKAALMFIHRWDLDNATYSVDGFRELALQLREEWLAWRENEPAGLTRRVADLVEQQLASTDEPPIQLLLPTSDRVIIRPLIDVWETEILSLAQQLELPTEPSGCSHTAAAATRTPREVLQFEVLHVLEAQRDLTALTQLVQRSYDAAGRLWSDSRRRRSELLGPDYKPSLHGLEKL